MDYYQFLVGLFQALAWPATVLILTTLILKNLDKIASTISSIKVSGIEVTLVKKQIEEITKDIQAETEKISKINANQGSSAIAMDPELYELAEKSPSIAIIEAWNCLERSLAESYEHSYGDGASYKNASAKAQALFSSGEISESIRNAIIEMNEIRNKVVHFNAHEIINKESAFTYLSAQAAISRYLEKIQHESPIDTLL